MSKFYIPCDTYNYNLWYALLIGVASTVNSLYTWWPASAWWCIHTVYMCLHLGISMKVCYLHLIAATCNFRLWVTTSCYVHRETSGFVNNWTQLPMLIFNMESDRFIIMCRPCPGDLRPGSVFLVCTPRFRVNATCGFVVCVIITWLRILGVVLATFIVDVA